MQQFLKRYVPFLQKGDYFFVIELFGPSVRGSLLLVEPQSKLVQIVKVAEIPFSDVRADSFIDALPDLLKKVRLPATARVLVLLDHKRVSMMNGSVALMRSDSKAEIRQAELQNLVSQGLWKLVNQHRPAVAKAMNIPELQVQLADADVMQVRLDHHRVVNPIGFAARSVEFWYRALFVDKALLQRLSAVLTDDNLAGVVEAPAVLAGFIARLNSQTEFLFISVGAHETMVYHGKEMICGYVDSFGWGTQTLLTGVAKHFGLSESAAAQLLGQYSHQAVSKEMRRAIEKAASGELAILSNGIAAHQPRDQMLPVYVSASVALPEFLFDTSFTRQLGLSLALTSVNSRFIGGHTGFVVQSTEGDPATSTPYTFDAAVSVIADWYAVSAMPLVSKAAKQRGRWFNTAGEH